MIRTELDLARVKIAKLEAENARLCALVWTLANGCVVNVQHVPCVRVPTNMSASTGEAFRRLESDEQAAYLGSVLNAEQSRRLDVTAVGVQK